MDALSKSLCPEAFLKMLEKDVKTPQSTSLFLIKLSRLTLLLLVADESSQAIDTCF